MRYSIHSVGLDGVPVEWCSSNSLRQALYIRDRLRLAEKVVLTDRPMYFVWDREDPERGTLDWDDVKPLPHGARGVGT